MRKNKPALLPCREAQIFVRNFKYLRRSLFIFCSSPYDEKVSHQDFLKASLDASVHLSLPSTFAPVAPGAVLTAASQSDKTLEEVLSLSC